MSTRHENQSSIPKSKWSTTLQPKDSFLVNKTRNERLICNPLHVERNLKSRKMICNILTTTHNLMKENLLVNLTEITNISLL